jgi:hypothetical protein
MLKKVRKRKMTKMAVFSSAVDLLRWLSISVVM